MLTISWSYLAVSNFMPHGSCYLWKPWLLRLHMVSDGAIALSYFCISLTLVHIINQRDDIPFDWMFSLFAGFIIFCGTGHIIDVWTLWHPDYWVSGAIKAITAITSLITTVALIYLIPQIMVLPSPKQWRQIEASLKEKEQFLRSIYEGVAESIFVVDVHQGEYIYKGGNPTFQLITAKSSAQLEGKTPEEILPPQAAADVRQRCERCVETGQPVIYEECLKLGGTDTWWLTILNAVRNGESQIYRIVGTSFEITDRKIAQEQLRESERRFRAVFNQTFQFMGLLQLDGTLVEVNQTALNFIGLTKAEVINRPFWETPWWRADAQEQLKQAISQAAQGKFVRYEVDITGRDSIATIDFSLKPVFDEQGLVVQLIPEGRDITKTKQALAALSKSEERWQLVLRGTGDGIFEWNIHTDEVILSARLKEMQDFADDEVENSYQGWRNLVHPEDIARVEESIKAHLDGRWPQYVSEYRLRCKHGGYKWILARGLAQWDDMGKPMRMVGSHQDISARKQAEAEILRLNQELEARVKRRTAQLEAANQRKDELLERQLSAQAKIQMYEDIVRNIPVGVCVWQLQKNEMGGFCLVAKNPAASQAVDVEIHDCVDQQLAQCGQDGLSDRKTIATMEIYREVIHTQQVKEIGEYRKVSDRCGEVIFDVKAFPLSGNNVGVSYNNVTKRKQIASALAESERLYRTVVNSVKEVIFQIDTAGNWTFLSAAWREITGFSIEESLNQPFTDLMYSSEDKQRTQELFQCLLAGETDNFQLEFRILTASRNFRWLEMCAQINRNAEDKLLGISGTLNDVTERKQTEAVLEARAEELSKINALLLQTTTKLQKRNEELDQFAYVTSHDLKAPLRAIANLSEWLEEDLCDALTPETREQMDLLRGRVHRMEGLINGLLQYSRVGRVKNLRETVSVNKLLRETIDSLAPPPGFTVEVGLNMPTFVTEKLPLQQVFSNLISNAIKHHHRDTGNINISVQDKGRCYQFAVADDGPGIDPQYHHQVFVIFRTLEARDTRESTGVGLSIVKKAVETQGGKIWLESQLGKGTTFYFTWSK